MNIFLRKQALIFVFIISFLFLSNISFAQPLDMGASEGIADSMNKMAGEAGMNTGGSGSDLQLPALLANIIKIFLSLLGIIFTIIIIYAGYVWMTAGGSEEKVSKAKNLIQRSIIGFIIILSAYAITYFVFRSISMGGTMAG